MSSGGRDRTYDLLVQSQDIRSDVNPQISCISACYDSNPPAETVAETDGFTVLA